MAQPFTTGMSGPAAIDLLNNLHAIATAATLPEVAAPANVSPANAAAGVAAQAVLTGSAFYSLYNAEHAATQVQISTSASFAAPLYSSGDLAPAVSFTLPAGILGDGASYYWRMRYKNAREVYGDWSAPTSFTTQVLQNDYIATPAATPAAFGDPFEGGFYAGMIWNEISQSATNLLIATGTKSFSVPDMGSQPIVYAGQTLEVRSRANPANKLLGTVTRALGGTLTISVVSTGGAGTFSDWSIMSRYRVIVAPKSSGESTGLKLKHTNTALPAACSTLSEGRKSTLAMVAAGLAAAYPAAWFCVSLNVGGRTDWYLPARDELELCWRNLKPVANDNMIVDRPSPPTYDYRTLGAYADVSLSQGANNNSSPAGIAYTPTLPAMVAADKNFRAGQPEAFITSSSLYWSSSDYSLTGVWIQFWHASAPGVQNIRDKSSEQAVRAVRRSII